MVNHPFESVEDLHGNKFLLQKSWLVDESGMINQDFLGVVDNIDEHAKSLKQALVDLGVINDIQHTQSNIEGMPDSVPHVNIGSVAVDRNGKKEKVLKEPDLWRRYYENNEVFEAAKEILKPDILLLNEVGYGICV